MGSTSDTTSDQTYEYAAATVISGTSVGPGATTPVQFEHSWSTSGGITYANGQTETWSNGDTYTNPAQSGFILPSGLTVQLTVPGAAPSAALTAANYAQPPAGDLILLDSGTLPSGKTWELWGDDVNWYYKEYNANGDLIEERSGPHSQSTYSALLVAKGISLEMQQQARTVYRNFLNSMTDLELSAWYNMSAEERQAAFHEWHWNKLKELTARLATVQNLSDRIDSLHEQIRSQDPFLPLSPQELSVVYANISAFHSQLTTEQNVIDDIRRELALNPPRTAEELGVRLEDPDGIFWSVLLDDPNTARASGVLRVAGSGAMLYAIGAASGPIGWIGIAAALYYSDQFAAGMYEIRDGTPRDSLLHDGLTAAGASDGAATGVELILDLGLGYKVYKLVAPKGLPTTTAESVKDKLARYLLNANHPKGGDKATWFRKALGFTQDNLDDLARQIRFDPANAVATELTQFGQKYEQVIEIVGANGRRINVLFVWIRNNDGVIRLVTSNLGV